MALFKTNFTVEKSINIKASPSLVFKYITEQERVDKWSPWLIIEPKAKTESIGSAGKLGYTYSWDGEIIGAGSEEIVEVVKDTFIKTKLLFTRPFKSENSSIFQIKKTKTGVKLIWTMTGELPIFLFFLKGMVSHFVGMDFKRGLTMLKDLIETKKLNTSTQIKGIKSPKSFYYIGMSNSGSEKELEKQMMKIFTKLTKFSEKHNLTPKLGMSLYHKVDLKKDIFKYTSGLIVNKSEFEKAQNLLPEDIFAGEFTPGTAVNVTHNGAYKYMTNSWVAGNMFIEAKKMKRSKTASFEIYKNDPTKVKEKDLITEIYIPVQETKKES